MILFCPLDILQGLVILCFIEGCLIQLQTQQECLELSNSLIFYHHPSLVSCWMRDASSQADMMGCHPFLNARTVHVQETWKQTKTRSSQKAAPACSQPSREGKTCYPSQWFICLYCSGKCLLQLVAEKTDVFMGFILPSLSAFQRHLDDALSHSI